MQKILVYTYFSENCYNTVKYAIDLGIATDTPVRILHYYKSPKSAGMLLSIDKRLHDDAIKEMSRLKERLIGEYPIEKLEPVEAIVGFGETMKSIKKSIKNNKADLLIVSAKEEYDSSELFLGSVSGKLIRQTNIPVLIIPSKARFVPIKNILLTVKKLKAENKSMLKPLSSLIKLCQADLSILTFLNKDKIKKSDIGDNLKKLKPISIENAQGENLYSNTISYLEKNKFDVLAVIRKKKGFFNNFLNSNVVEKKKFIINFPLLVLAGK